MLHLAGNRGPDGPNHGAGPLLLVTLGIGLEIGFRLGVIVAALAGLCIPYGLLWRKRIFLKL